LTCTSEKSIMAWSPLPPSPKFEKNCWMLNIRG
jgi:hypothetical protein